MKDLFFKTIMLKGEAGGTIASIEKTSSELNVDTYTITLNDGETSTFEVTNGTSIASIAKTGTSGLVDTYTITLTDGSTTTFEVTNGEDAAYYELPSGSVVYFDSEDNVPQGYEGTVNPNAARLNSMQSEIDTMDNNLVLGSNFAALGAGCGWVFNPNSGSPASPGFVFVNGLMVPNGCNGVLTSPRVTDFSNSLGSLYDYSSMTFSVSILFSSYASPIGQDIPLTLAKIEDVNYNNKSSRVYNYENILEISVETIAEGGYFRLNISNISSDFDIAIKAVKLEIGGYATPYRFMSPLNGINNYLKAALVVDSKSVTFTPVAQGSSNVTINVEKSNYTAIGILGITGSNTSVLTYSDFYLESATSAKVYYYNRSSLTDSTTITLKVLYIAN